MTTCTCNNTRGHFAWCSAVGGPGYSPGSLEGAIAQARAHVRAAAELAPPVPTPTRKDTNNGWWSTRPNPSPSFPQAGMPQKQQPIQQGSPLSSSQESTQPRKSTRWNGDDPSTLHREYRDLIEPLCREQGWRFVRQRNSRKPYVVSPDGRRFTLPITPDDTKLAIKRARSQLRRMGAKL